MWRFSQRKSHILTPKTRLSSLAFHQQQNQDLVDEIITILKRNKWIHLLDLSEIPKRLNLDVVRYVLHQNQVGLDSTRLLNFFRWYEHKLGSIKDLDTMSILVVNLCNSHCYRASSGVIDRMIRSCSCSCSCFCSSSESSAFSFTVCMVKV
ncbi:hypothetical protein CsSME_00039756 [Camellia sinensis var. sinensis]